MANTLFELIEYSGVRFPESYNVKIKEIAGHLDKEEILQEEFYSLHTEYSYGKRKLNNHILGKYPTIMDSNKNGIPQLWKNEAWANEFADFILELTRGKTAPSIIEIHPPFDDYIDIGEFVNCYKVFEGRIHEYYPRVKIFIENRSGSLYRGGRFLISKSDDIVDLCRNIEDNGVDLGIVLDFPQLLTAERIDTLKFNADKYNSAIDKIYQYRHLVKGIHIWGKKKNPKGRWVSHCGNFDTYFDGNIESKMIFIDGILRICDDGEIRFLVPEVNSGMEDLMSIIDDIMCAVSNRNAKR